MVNFPISKTICIPPPSRHFGARPVALGILLPHFAHKAIAVDVDLAIVSPELEGLEAECEHGLVDRIVGNCGIRTAPGINRVTETTICIESTLIDL